jgi:hypothetical protein
MMENFMNLWPPFLGAGLKVVEMNEELTKIVVELRSHFWNRNYVGVHYGGSLYSMADPFYMLMLLENLGPNYIVWDKAATIRFRSPGRGNLRARFELTPQEILSIKEQADRDGKAEPKFMVQIKDKEDKLVAEVEKVISVKLKQKDR